MQLEAKGNSRTSKSAVNFGTGILMQLVILVLNFVVRYIFIKKIGYDYLGINSLFSGILTILSVADLGFGSALGIVLYSSLAKKNENEIAGLMNFFKKVYFVIGIIVTVLGLAITPFVKYLVNTDADIPNLSIYFLLFLLNTISSYFVSYRAILIRADQKNSVVNYVTTFVKVGKALLETLVLLVFPVLIGLTGTYIGYLIVMVLSTYAIGIITSIYAKKKYPYAFSKNAVVDKDKKKEIISTTKDLFVYRVCAAFSTPIDSIIISVFVGTTLLGIYSNYLLIFTTLLEFICLLSRNVISSVGNFVVEKPIEEQKKLYFEMQIVYFAIIIFCTINFVALASPFISLIFGSENQLSIWVVFLLGASLICRCAGELAIIFRETTKIYKKTKYISLFNTGLHIGLSLLLGHFMGLEGILLGNVIAYFATNFWFEIFALFKWHFKETPVKSLLQFLYVIFITVGLSVAMYFLTSSLASKGGFLYFVLSAIASLVVSVVALLALYPIDGFASLFARVKKICSFVASKIVVIHNNKIINVAVILTYIVSMTVLVLLRDILAFNISKFVFFGIFVLAVLLLSKKKAIWIILFSLPIAPTLAELYFLLFALVYFIVIEFKKFSIKKWLLIFAIPASIFVLEILLSLFYGSIQLPFALRIFVLLSILAIAYYDREVFTKKHIQAFVLGCLFFFTIIAINWWAYAIYGVTHKNEKYAWLSIPVLLRECRFGDSVVNWISYFAHVEYPYISSQTVIENPNNIALICVVCSATIMALYGTATRRSEKLINILLLLAFLVFGVWSQSRTFIIVYPLLIVVEIFIPLLTKRRDVIDALTLLTLIGFGVTIVFLAKPDLLKNIIKRFSESSTSSGGGRIDLLVGYFKFIFSDWRYALFGVSCTNLVNVANVELNGTIIPPHTNVVQFIGSYGLLFFFAFITFLVLSFKFTKKVKIRSPFIYLIVPILFTIIFTFTLQLFLPSIILITFIPGVLCLSLLNVGNSNEKNVCYTRNKPRVLEQNETVKLAMCSTSFGGGIASYIKNISPYLIESGIEEQIIYNPDTTESEKQRFEHIKCPKISFDKKQSKFKLLHLWRKYDYYLKSFNNFEADIVYINTSSYTRSLILFIAAAFYKKGTISIHCHRAVNNESKLPVSERIIRWFLSFWNISKYACSIETGKVFFGKKFLNGKEKHQGIITNFIDANKFAYSDENREKIRSQYGIKNKEIILGSVGRLAKAKNQLFLIKVLNQLPKKYKLMILGDGPLKDNIVSEVSKYDLEDRVITVGNTPAANEYYSAFDIFVLPSFAEGLPFVSVEAQCSGLLNILNEGLPHSTAITKKVVFLPLNEKSWVNMITNCDLASPDKRKKAFKNIIDADYSTKTAPAKIVGMIKAPAYER